MPLSLLAQFLSMPLGAVLVKEIGASRTLLISGIVFSLAVFLSSFAKSLFSFLFCYSFLLGSGIGIGYTAPMTAGWKWLPESKGLISGAILTGFGTGGFIFNLVGTRFVNPEGIDPVDGKFPPQIYFGFPGMLRKLAVIYGALCVLGSMLITEPRPSGKRETASVPGVEIIEAIKTPQFYLIWLMIFTCASAGLNVASVYKQFAAVKPALAGHA